MKEWDWKSSLTTATSPSQRGQRGARVAVQGPGMKELTHISGLRDEPAIKDSTASRRGNLTDDLSKMTIMSELFTTKVACFGSLFGSV